jgi:hypothetical protein
MVLATGITIFFRPCPSLLRDSTLTRPSFDNLDTSRDTPLGLRCDGEVSVSVQRAHLYKADLPCEALVFQKGGSVDGQEQGGLGGACFGVARSRAESSGVCTVAWYSQRGLECAGVQGGVCDGVGGCARMRHAGGWSIDWPVQLHASVLAWAGTL